MERHLGGFAEQFLDAVRIFHAGELDHDAVVALLGDLGVDDAGLVDTAADDLDGLLDGAVGGSDEGLAREGDGDVVAGEVTDGKFARHAGLHGAQGADRGVVLRRVAQMQEHALVGGFGGEVLVADVLVEQGRARGVGERIESFVLDGFHVHLHQQVAAAAQVQPEMDAAPGHPGGGGGEEVRQA